MPQFGGLTSRLCAEGSVPASRVVGGKRPTSRFELGARADTRELRSRVWRGGETSHWVADSRPHNNGEELGNDIDPRSNRWRNPAREAAMQDANAANHAGPALVRGMH